MKAVKFVEFNLVGLKPKTEIYGVRNIKSQAILGYVKWYSSWRQYCFLPEPNTIFSVGCMEDIRDFTRDLNIKHRSK
jgi:hypothetical protein